VIITTTNVLTQGWERIIKERRKKFYLSQADGVSLLKWPPNCNWLNRSEFAIFQQNIMHAGGIKCQRRAFYLSYIISCCWSHHTHEQHIICLCFGLLLFSSCPLYTIYFLSDKRRTGLLLKFLASPRYLLLQNIPSDTHFCRLFSHSIGGIFSTIAQI